MATSIPAGKKGRQEENPVPVHTLVDWQKLSGGRGTTGSLSHLARLTHARVFGRLPESKITEMDMATRRSRVPWPDWQRPNESTLLALVKKVTPFVRFLDPEIVAAVVVSNNRHRAAWRKKLKKDRDIDPDIYLWKGSSCAFPGIRRHAGKKELAAFNHTGETDGIRDALKLDGNSYPKQIWSFVLRGQEFRNSGPSGYSLAHLADHKDYKNRLLQEFDGPGSYPAKLYGLFTAPSNTVYMPDNLLKLTDFNPAARLLLLNKAQELYGDVCNIVPPGLEVRQQQGKWAVDEFKWAEPVKAKDESAVQAFLDFRDDVMKELL